MTSAELLERYDAISQITQDMLEAARQGKWDELAGFVQTRTSLTEHLMKQENPDLWGADELNRRNDLIRNVLAADEEIKILTKSWMNDLREQLGSVGTEAKLNKAYETP